MAAGPERTAIAASRGLPVVTQDGDFDALEGVAGLTIIRV